MRWPLPMAWRCDCYAKFNLEVESWESVLLAPDLSLSTSYTPISMNITNLRALTGLTLVAAGIAIPNARAQSPRTVYLYNASLGSAPAGVSSAKTAPWGNGEIKATRQPVEYEGASVMEVTTRNFAEGARFDLKTPINIDSYIEKGFVRLRLKFAADTTVAGGFPGQDGGGFPGGPDGGGFPGGPDGGGFQGGGFQGDGGGFGGRGRFRGNQLITPHTQANAQFGAPGALPQFGGRPGGGGFPGGPGGFQGGGFPGGDGTDGGFPGAAMGPAPQKTDITDLRVTLVRENGVLVGNVPIDLEKTTPDDGGWRLFVLPINQMKATPGSSGPVSRVVLTSDEEDTFFMAQAAIVIETGKMEVSVRPTDAPEGSQMAEITVKPGAVTLIADVEAGAADPQVEWNFDADNVGNFAPPTPPGGFPGGPDGGGFDPRGGGFPGGPGGFPGGPGGFPGGPGGFPGGPGGFPGGPGGFPGAGGLPDGGALGPDGMPVAMGPRVDARGLTATFTYPNEEQNYRVEVKVTDKSGKKEPVTSSIIVKVRN